MLAAAQAHYAAQKALTTGTVQQAQSLWAQLDPARIFASLRADVGPRLLAQVVAAQLLAASRAEPYVRQALLEQGLPPTGQHRVVPQAFAGVASDGRDLATLLEQPAVAAALALQQGQPAPSALATGAQLLVLIVATQVADAGRDAESVAIATRPRTVGWVRMLTPPSCARCAILAGRFYRWNSGFRRHPLCDCRHIPASEDTARDLRTDPTAAFRSGQVTGLSQADRRAIAEGADLNQVVNAQRGTYTAAGRSFTREGTTVRGAYGRSLRDSAARRPGERYARASTPRLRPEEIYRQAGDDRAEAQRLLRRFGYLE